MILIAQVWSLDGATGAMDAMDATDAHSICSNWIEYSCISNQLWMQFIISIRICILHLIFVIYRSKDTSYNYIFYDLTLLLLFHYGINYAAVTQAASSVWIEKPQKWHDHTGSYRIAKEILVGNLNPTVVCDHSTITLLPICYWSSIDLRSSYENCLMIHDRHQ